MKPDELKKEAEKYAEQCYGWTNNDLALDVAEATYIASAEPREKRIAEASEIINDILEYFRNKTISYPYCMLEVLAKAQQFIDDNTPWEIIKGVSND